MQILVTFPGKFGDILWALPSVRALAEATGASIDLAVAPPYASLCPLIEAQPYVGRAFAIPDWAVVETAPMTPWQAPKVEGYDAQIDLGYRGWPDQPLAQYTFARLRAEACWAAIAESALELGRPWITAPFDVVDGEICDEKELGVTVGFSDDHFELKYGLYQLVLGEWDYAALHPTNHVVLAPQGSRWHREGGTHPSTWYQAAVDIAQSHVFFGCCSALHVVAVALGVPVVMMEPASARHNDIFFPLGTQGPQVTLVTGVDQLPTWDARHVADAVRQALEGQ